jgi:hypothetical protein
VYSAQHMEIWDHERLQARRALDGSLMGLDAGMQQPTACRKYEGGRVRCVAPKLSANGESHARERQPSSGPQDWAVTWQ